MVVGNERELYQAVQSLSQKHTDYITGFSSSSNSAGQHEGVEAHSIQAAANSSESRGRHRQPRTLEAEAKNTELHSLRDTGDALQEHISTSVPRVVNAAGC